MVDAFINFRTKDADVDSIDPIVRIDTARIYAGGESERMLGLALEPQKEQSFSYKISIGTKAHPSQPNGLSPQGLRSQLESSLEAMNLSSVNEFYLHQPDEHHPLLDSLQTLHLFVQEGLISNIGMSNYHAAEVQRCFDLCNEHGLTKPTVYQGLYNPLNRCVEDELLPVLRRNGCRFVAYNPLAGGMLTGKHLSEKHLAVGGKASGGDSRGGGEVKEGRFKNNPNYLPRFYTPSNFRALELIQSACEDANISMVEASYRWLLRHSALHAGDVHEGGDGILIGASSMEQLEENFRCCRRARDVSKGDDSSLSGKLPQAVVNAFDAAWEIIRDDDSSSSGPFPYWRSYSSDMPGRESLDSGASYSAIKAK